jgi:hypothetical protein
VALLKVVPGPVPSQLGKSSDHYRALKVKSFPHLHFHNSHCCFFTQPAYQGSSKPSSGSSGAVTSALYFISDFGGSRWASHHSRHNGWRPRNSKSAAPTKLTDAELHIYTQQLWAEREPKECASSIFPRCTYKQLLTRDCRLCICG